MFFKLIWKFFRFFFFVDLNKLFENRNKRTYFKIDNRSLQILEKYFHNNGWQKRISVHIKHRLCFDTGLNIDTLNNWIKYQRRKSKRQNQKKDFSEEINGSSFFF